MQFQLDEDKSRFNQDRQEAAEKQIIDRQKISDYDIREYPVEVIVDKFVNGLESDEAEIFIPDYQREMVWKLDQQSRFIESILINLPVPYLFVADNDGRLEIVDGSQRIRTLVSFMQNSLTLSGLTLLSEVNDFRFCDLPKSRQRRFSRKTIRLIELTENMDEEARRQMFDRLNSGGTKLTSMEQRMGSRDGGFLKFIKELANSPKLIELCPISTARTQHREHEELVLRYFAYLEKYKSFNKRVDSFLDDYLDDKNNNGFNGIEMADEFNKMLEFIESNFQYGFRKTANNKSVPRIRFEAMAIGTTLALRENPELKIETNDWIFGKEFGHLTRSDASNSRPKLINRLHFVRDNLLNRNVEYEGDPEKIFADPRKIDVQSDIFGDS
ncbi:DUF262 domain-containing protein [Microbulbifer sp. VTAC004]|uniref:DUF262 domain-containing protein n=1 Tax=Microbulbifer sp. VTAC004 TaxID=3243386 RepID=UPI00403900C9